MVQAKQPHNAPTIAMPPTQTTRDCAVSSIIAGLNYLILQAQSTNLGTAARILYTAKEDMVHWAVDMDFHESARDQFVNAQMFGPLGPHNAAMLAHIQTIRPASHYNTDESAQIPKE